MRKLVSLAAVFGIGLTGLQSAAKAENWWMVVYAEARRNNFAYTVPMESETQCEAAGAKLIGSSAKNGRLSRVPSSGGNIRVGFECIIGGR